MMKRLDSADEHAVTRIVEQNDEAAQAVMRRHFHIDVRDITEYDIGFNTDRMSIAQCVDEVLAMVQSPQFAETEESHNAAQRAACADVAGRMKGVQGLENRLRTGDIPSRHSAL
jgi:hypothetical protein